MRRTRVRVDADARLELSPATASLEAQSLVYCCPRRHIRGREQAAIARPMIEPGTATNVRCLGMLRDHGARETRKLVASPRQIHQCERASVRIRFAIDEVNPYSSVGAGRREAEASEHRMARKRALLGAKDEVALRDVDQDFRIRRPARGVEERQPTRGRSFGQRHAVAEAPMKIRVVQQAMISILTAERAQPLCECELGDKERPKSRRPRPSVTCAAEGHQRGALQALKRR